MTTSRKASRCCEATGRHLTTPIRQTRNNTSRRGNQLFGYRKPSRRAGSNGKKPSWRDFYDIDPAAAFFHQFSGPEQLRELAEDIDRQQVIFEPIHTGSTAGTPRPFVIDGISRLDGAESTSRQIINAKGEWMGMLSSAGNVRHVVHHPGKTDKEVWSIALSLNLKRRHHTTGQLAEIADKLATRTVGRAKTANLQNKGSGDQSANLRIAPTVEQAAKMVGVSPRSVQAYRKVKTAAPEKLSDIRKAKLSLGKAASELAEAKPRKPKKEVDKLSPEHIHKRFGMFRKILALAHRPAEGA